MALSALTWCIVSTGIDICWIFCAFQLDHFSFTGKDTFRQRYLVYNNYWKGTGSPIFFYTGNEGDIVWFYNNTVSVFT